MRNVFTIKLIIKTPEPCHLNIFGHMKLDIFEHISYIFLVFLLLSLNKILPSALDLNQVLKLDRTHIIK